MKSYSAPRYGFRYPGPHAKTAGPGTGFTIIELLVVITIIGVLAALLFPAMKSVISSSKSMKCASNLRQIGTGLHMYANENNGRFPYAYKSKCNDTSASDYDRAWMSKIAPYLGIPDAVLVASRAVGVLVCPEHTMDATRKVAYGYNIVIETINRSQFTQFPQFRELGWEYKRMAVAPSKTFLVVEMEYDGECCSGTLIPGTTTWAGGLLKLRHPNKSANFLFVDGHVENLKSGDITKTNPGWYTPAQ